MREVRLRYSPKNLFYIHPGICYYHTGFIEEMVCGFSGFFDLTIRKYQGIYSDVPRLSWFPGKAF